MSGLRVRDLGFNYGAKRALDGVGFALAAGEFAALLGPNGAGKSTLFALLTRLYRAPEGEIAIAGHSLDHAPLAALGAIGVVFQQPTLDLDLTVRQNLRYAAALQGLAGRTAEVRIDAALDRLAMRARDRERVRALNGGHRRRTEIARALLHCPSVLLLDEATVGLDAEARAAITAHVHRLTVEDGLTVLWATHLTDEVDVADRLLVLHRGRLIADGRADMIAAGRPLKDAFLAMTGEVRDDIAL